MKKLLLILLCVPLIFSCGDTNNLDRKITGDMVNNGYTGKGTLTYPEKFEYVGEFKEGLAHGQGTIISLDSTNIINKYVGEYRYGKKNGQGTLTYTDGTIKKGLWENGKFIGEQ